MKFKVCLSAAVVLCLSVKAQDTLRTEDIQEVYINAERTYGAGSVSNEKKADERLLQATGALQVSDVMKYFSGATVKDYGGIGGLKTVSVRGLGASHTAVAYDGVIITDNQTGQTDLGRFSAGQTEAVRLVSGPDNDMLQTAAMAAQAATINVNGHRPELDGEKFKGSARLLAGSFGTLNAQAETDFHAGRNSVATAGVEWLQSDGDYPYVQDNGSSSTTLSRKNSDIARLRAEAALFSSLGASDLTVRAYWFQSQQGLPANILYNENAANERLWNRNGFIQSTLRTDLSQRMTMQICAKYGVARTRYLNPSVNSISGVTDNRYTEQELYLSAVLMYRITGRLSASVAEDGRLSELDGVTVRPTRGTLNSSIALKYASERLVLTGRLNHVATKEDTRLNTAARNFSHLSPVTGANWLIWPALGLHVRASYENTYRLPTFNDLYFEQVGRRDLKPEQASVTSGGIVLEKQAAGMSVSIYADAFNSCVSDRILAVPGKNTAVWMMKNVGRVTTHGLETGLETACQCASVRTGLTASYTYQRAMDKSDASSATWNHQLPYTPRHSASGVVFIETPYLNASCNLIYSGKYYCNSYNGPEYAMSSYYEAGCSLWKDIHMKQCDICLKAECVNMTDSRYELVRNYPMPGRQLRVTLSIDL